MRGAPLAFALLALAVRGAAADPPAADLERSAIEGLRRATSDPDRGVRFAAVEALGKAGADPAWIAVGLADPAWCVRQEAALWLRGGGAPALAALASALDRGGAETRSSVAWALSGHGEAAVPLLRKAISDAEEAIRVEALASVRRLGRAAGAPLLAAVAKLLSSASDVEAYEAAMTLLVLDPDRVDDAAPALRRAVERHIVSGREAIDLLFIDGVASKRLLLVLSKYPELAKPITARSARDQTPKPAPSADALPVDAPGTVAPPRPPGLSDAPGLRRALASGTVMQRIRAALRLGEAKADAPAIAAGLADPERDVRAAAARGLATATGDAAEPLVRALRDPSWRVRLAAIESLGARGARAADLAPFLADPNVAISNETAKALRGMGGAAALPTAEQMRSGDYAVLEYAPAIFDAAGEAGSAAVPALVALLAHEDVNVRETAARCLRAVGAGDREAEAALVKALGDRRLCVVANAALALGRLGLRAELLATLSDPRARVRAYGAFALGWALGERRHADQVPFEVRLPVLDLGDAGPFPTAGEIAARKASADATETGGHRDADAEAALAAVARPALRSKDPGAALPAALALGYEELDAEESERVMELLLPEGLRDNTHTDLEQVRTIIGSSELPACLAYLMLARRTYEERSSIYGTFHRTSRADSLPGIYWVQRRADPETLAGDGDLLMPEERTVEPLRTRAQGILGFDPGPDRAEIFRALLRESLKDVGQGIDTATLWLLADWTPTTSDDRRLAIRAAQAVEAPPVFRDGVTYVASHQDYARVAGLRVLGRMSDLASEEVLRKAAAGEDLGALVATASLARRGDAAALARLAERARGDVRAFLLFLDAVPREAAEALAGWLTQADSEGDVQALFEAGWTANATELGVRLRPDTFAGIEAVSVERARDPWVLGATGVLVPACRTARLAAKVLDLLERNPSKAAAPTPADEASTSDVPLQGRVVSFLYSADPSRTIAYLRRVALSQGDPRRDWARRALVRAGDRGSAPMLFAWLRADAPDGIDPAWIERFDGPEALAYLRERAADEKEGESYLPALARRIGWPRRVRFGLEEFEASRLEGVKAAVLRGDIEAAKKAYPRPRLLEDPLGGRTPVWRRLALAALAGDRGARAELWSGLRAGRLRWIHTTFEDDLQTLGHDPKVLPHWLSDLDSNCCRISDGMGEGAFEIPYGTPDDFYGTERNGIGEPPSRRALAWFALMGGRWVPDRLATGDRSPMLPEPE